ncbi:MAG: autotransporter assembly complex family protein [Granulosicoccus sp.]
MRFFNAVMVVVFLGLFLDAPAHAETSVVVTGVEGDLKTNVELIAGTPPNDDSVRKLRRYVAELPTLTKAAMSALGYYGADVAVKQKTDGENTILEIAVTPNDPVLIEAIDITIQGAGEDDAQYEGVLSELPLLQGAVFISGDYEATKSALLDRAQDLGYFDFTFTKSEVLVSRRQLSANIKLVADTGVRYTFGPIVFEQNVFRQSFLERWMPFKEDDPFESSLIGELSNNLQNSGYFKSVRVQPQQDRRYGKTIPIKVGLERKDNNQVALGVGFVTDTGLRTKLAWGKPLLNRFGHSLDFEVGLAEEQQNASVSYRIPRKNEPLYNYWGIEYGLKKDTVGDTDSFLSSLNFQRVSRTPSEWTESLFLRWERERFEVIKEEDGDEPPEVRTTDLILPGFSYTRSRSNGTPFPVWGQAETLLVMGGSTRALSSIDFFKVLGTFKYLQALSDRNTLIGSAQYGAIQSNDFDGVPVSQRFFAGGDRSVRGFKYREISPIINEQSVGGRYLEILSLEYNYRILDKWSAAIFSDAGRAFNSFRDSYRVGAGVGIRWQSPVGAFRLDIATPISDNDKDGSVRVHISLGPDL